jgi:hypothetical protein
MLLGSFLPQAIHAIKGSESMKLEPSRIACVDLLCLAAIKYQQVEEVASALVLVTRQGDHVPLIAAQVAKFADVKYNSTQLVSDLSCIRGGTSWCCCRGLPVCGRPWRMFFNHGASS